jgi:hypothetical protein
MRQRISLMPVGDDTARLLACDAQQRATVVDTVQRAVTRSAAVNVEVIALLFANLLCETAISARSHGRSHEDLMVAGETMLSYIWERTQQIIESPNPEYKAKAKLALH